MQVISLKYKRNYRLHLKTLLEVVKNKELLKCYSLYLSLQSLYKKKQIHDYKSRFQELQKKSGFSDYLFRKSLNKLFILGLVRVDKNNPKHLQIASYKSFMSFFNLKDEYYINAEKNAKKMHSGIKIYRESSMSYYDLQTLAIEIKMKQKRRMFSLGLHKSVEQKLSKKIQGLKKQEFSKQLGEVKSLNIFLYLNEIQKLFGLKSIQSANQLISKLEKEKLIKVENQYNYLYKVTNGVRENLNYCKNLFIRNNWAYEQLPNKITFVKPFLERKWYEEAIEEFLQDRKNKKRKNNENFDFKKVKEKKLKLSMIGKIIYKNDLIVSEQMYIRVKEGIRVVKKIWMTPVKIIEMKDLYNSRTVSKTIHIDNDEINSINLENIFFQLKGAILNKICFTPKPL